MFKRLRLLKEHTFTLIFKLTSNNIKLELLDIHFDILLFFSKTETTHAGSRPLK